MGSLLLAAGVSRFYVLHVRARLFSRGTRKETLFTSCEHYDPSYVSPLVEPLNVQRL